MSKKHQISYIESMATIGIYDSGIGGLTTMKYLLDEFKGNDFYYLADNKNHPFGNKKPSDIYKIVEDGVSKLKSHSDIQVLACNTSSLYYLNNDVFKLSPPIEKIDDTSLLMATDATLERIENKGKYAATSALATLIEVHTMHALRKGNICLDSLLPYLKKSIGKFYGVKKVILGCSHYPFVKSQIIKILGNVEFYDGNNMLLDALKSHIIPQNRQSKIRFEFTGENLSDEYMRILKFLRENSNCKT